MSLRVISPPRAHLALHILSLALSFSFTATCNAQLTRLDATAVEFGGVVRFTDFSIEFMDDGDGLLQFDEILTFSGTTELVDPFRVYDGIAYVPDIPGIAAASGTPNPVLPCTTCWELTPPSDVGPSDGWFTARWAYSLSPIPDEDGDGVPDATDNCLEVPNPDQRDTNGDGFGNICDADLDNDGIVTNVIDLGMLRTAFFSTPGAPNWNPDADFNGDDVVNAQDLGILRNYFFGPPGPIVNAFVNPAGGDWGVPTNWSLGVVPTVAHAVRIDLADDQAAVLHTSGTNRFNGLRASSRLTVLGGTLESVGTVQVNATLLLAGGTLKDMRIVASTTPDAMTVLGQPTLDGVIFGWTMTVADGTTLQIENGLTLDGGTVTLASSGSTTQLSLLASASAAPEAAGASAVLGGTGDVIFGGSTTSDTANRIRAANNTTLVIGSGVSVRTGSAGGSLFAINAPIDFSGTLIADLNGRRVTVGDAVFGGPLLLSGSVNGSNGADIVLRAPAGSVLSGAIAMTGGSTLSIEGSGSYTIGPGATIDVMDGALALSGAWINEGQITATSSTFSTGDNPGEMWLNNGTITLTGTPLDLGGGVSLAALGNLVTDAELALSGELDNTGQSLDLGTAFPGSFRFAGGTIRGGSLVNTPLTVGGGSFNPKLDDVTLEVDVTIENGETLGVKNTLTLSDVTITLTSTGSATKMSLLGPAATTVTGVGDIVFGGTTVFTNLNLVAGSNNVPVTIGPGVTVRTGTAVGQVSTTNVPLDFQGQIVSDLYEGTIVIGATQFTGALHFSGTASVADNASLVLLTANGGLIDGTIVATGSQLDFGAVVLTGVSGTYTIGANAMIDVTAHFLSFLGAWINEGTVQATDAGLFETGNDDAQSWTNNGSIALTNTITDLGGRFTVADIGNFTTSNTVRLSGVLDNTGQSLDIASVFPGLLELNRGTILGGTIATTPLTFLNAFTLDSVQLAVDAAVNVGQSLWVRNSLELDNATITLAGAVAAGIGFVGPTMSSIIGNGEIVFNGGADHALTGSNGVAVTLGAGITVRSGTGGGRIDTRNAPLTLNATVISDVPGRSITLGGSFFTGQTDVAGSVQAVGGDIVLFGAPLSVSGSLQIDAGSQILAQDACTFLPGATLSIGIAGTAASDYGRFDATGESMTIDGTLALSLENGFAPSLGDTFDVLSFDSATGAFASVTGTDIGGGQALDVNYTATTVTLETVASP